MKVIKILILLIIALFFLLQCGLFTEPRIPDEKYNNRLSSIIFSNGTMSPAFSPDETSYSISVDHLEAATKVTPLAEDSQAVITVNGVAVVSGEASGDIILSPENNTITIEVTTPDDSSRAYTIKLSPGIEDTTNSGCPATPRLRISMQFSA